MAESSPLDVNQLADWVEGRLSEEAALLVAARVAAADQTAQSMVAWLRAFTQVSAQVELVAPPRETHAALMQQFTEFARQRKGPGLVQRLMAALTFDSGQQPMVAGVRSAAVQPSQRQLLYSTELVEVAINIHPRHQDQRLDLSGQLFTQSDLAIGGRVVQLMRGDTPLDIATTDDLGEFGFEAVPPGDYVLSMSIDHTHILIAPVELRT